MLKIFLPDGKNSKTFQFLAKLGEWIKEQKCFKLSDHAQNRAQLFNLKSEKIWVDDIVVVENDKTLDDQKSKKNGKFKSSNDEWITEF